MKNFNKFLALVVVFAFSMIMVSAAPTNVVLFNDDFESGDLSLWDTLLGTPTVTDNGTLVIDGTWSAYFDGAGDNDKVATASLDSTGYKNIRVIYSLTTTGLDDDGENFRSRYSTDAGATYTTIEELTGGEDKTHSETLPVNAENNANLLVMFRIKGSDLNDYVVLDNVQVIGDEIDNDAPVVDNFQVDPTAPTTEDNVEVCVDITDASEITNVDLDCDASNGWSVSGPMALDSGNTWCGDISALTLHAVDLVTVTCSVTAEDEPGNSDTTTSDDPLFTFDGLAPDADANGPYSCDEGQTVGLDASGSTDTVDGSLDYAWDLDNDGDYDDSINVNPNFSCVDDGDYTVSVQVTDDAGFTSTDDSIVTVSNVDPVANANGPYTANEGETFNLGGSVSDDGVEDTHTFAWDLDNDGIYETLGQDVEFTCENEDTHTVSLQVTDDDEGIGVDTTTVTCENAAPEVDAGEDQTVDEGDALSVEPAFTDYVDDTHTATINWGDGTAETSFDPATSPLSDTHTYVDNGVYTVTVLVTDDNAAIGSDTLIVTVNNVVPVANANGPYEVQVEENIQLEGSATDVGTSDTFTYEWDFDYDGSFITDSTDEDPTTSYSEEGTYTVALRVTDDDGGISEIATSTVTVYSWMIELNDGWNLISVPLVPLNGDGEVDTSIGNALLDPLSNCLPGGTEYVVQSYQYDGDSGENAWFTSRKSAYGDLDTVVPGYGYWVKVDASAEGCDLTLRGTGQKYLDYGMPPSVNLMSDWNLIGKYGRTTVLKGNQVDDLVYDQDVGLMDLADYTVVDLDNGYLPSDGSMNMHMGYWALMGGNNGDTITYTPSELDYDFS